MSESQDQSERFSNVVATAKEFDQFAAAALPQLLDRATTQTKRFLKETGQWEPDITHEKLALRWGYELVERFLVCGRTEVPCRPLFLLDSLIAKYYSQPEPLCYHKDLLSPLGRFLDGLTSRAVVSRDGLMALFYHLYGFGQGHVVKTLGLGMAESQRVYKNFERWRQSGWQRTMEEMGMTDTELNGIEEQKRHHPERLNAEADRLTRLLLAHYRKSEPEHYPCLSRQKWDDLFGQDYGYDYRVWHLAFCHDCFTHACDLRGTDTQGAVKPRIDLQVRPLQKGGLMAFFMPERGGGKGHGTGRATQRLSHTPA
ncbi:MAG: hypothetical protein ACT4OO_15110 [Nitrospiraceae bacterium]